MASETERDRLGRDDWIEAALDALVERGIEGVRIDRLCQRLGVTKGSFYHHFARRDDLLEGLVDFWANTQPKATTHELASSGTDAMARLVAVTRLVADRDIGRRDHAMRAWAAADPRAARAVQQADCQILALLHSLLRDLGVPSDEIHPLSRVLFFSALGAYEAPTAFAGRSQRSFARYLLRLVQERARGAPMPGKEIA